MNNKYLIPGLFVLVIIAQLYVPASMILEREDILTTGKTYKFETRPVDPTDPMRGKYIILGFENDQIKIAGDTSFFSGQEVFVVPGKNKEGFVIINELKQEKPDGEYIKADLGNVYYQEEQERCVCATQMPL